MCISKVEHMIHKQINTWVSNFLYGSLPLVEQG
jgi:hypothetical protein